MIAFRNVSKSYWTGRTRKVILNDASFTIEGGRSLGILAPNGTGKTTLINMMAGLELPDEGRILRQARISFPLGSVAGLSRNHSAQENARYIARIYGLDPDEVEAFCRYLCDLGDYFEMPLSTYSQGMKARVMFALMLSIDFDVYLVDEGLPSTIDARFNRLASGLLKERLAHATVVMVSHRPEVLEEFCESAAVLKDGTLALFDTLAEAKELYDYAM